MTQLSEEVVGRLRRYLRVSDGKALIPTLPRDLRAAIDTIEDLVAALRPFADCMEYIGDEEDDDEWAKFRLVIKNYRDAAKALAKAKGGSQ
jgi:hypothetical protein